MPRTLEEFAQNSRITKRDLGRCFRLIHRELDIHFPTPSINRFICRFGNDLNITAKTQRMAIEIVNRAQKIGLTAGKDPCGLAAASIYVASMKNGERKTQREIAKISQVTEVTVRNRYKDLIKSLHINMRIGQ